MISNMLHFGFEDKADFHRYMDQTVDCWDRHLAHPEPNSLFGQHFQPFTAFLRLLFHHNHPGQWLGHTVSLLYRKITSVSHPILTSSYDYVNSQVLTTNGHSLWANPNPALNSMLSLSTSLSGFPDQPLLDYDQISISDILRMAPTLTTTAKFSARLFQSLIEYERLLFFADIHPFSAQTNSQQQQYRNQLGQILLLRSSQHKHEVVSVIQETITTFDNLNAHNHCSIDRLKLLLTLYSVLPNPFSTTWSSQSLAMPTSSTFGSARDYQLFDVDREIQHGMECIFANFSPIASSIDPISLNIQQQWAYASNTTIQFLYQRFQQQQEATRQYHAQQQQQAQKQYKNDL